MRTRYRELFQRLQNPNPRQVDEAYDSILFEREKAISDLIEGYRTETMPTQVRYLIIQLLGFTESNDALPVVIEALNDPEPKVRAEACRSLIDLRAKKTLSFLRQRLEDMDPDVRQAARDAISILAK